MSTPPTRRRIQNGSRVTTAEPQTEQTFWTLLRVTLNSCGCRRSMGESVGSSINQLSPRISTRSLNVSWLGDFGHVAYFVCKFGILTSPSGRLVANGLDGRPRRRRSPSKGTRLRSQGGVPRAVARGNNLEAKPH